MKKLRVSQIVKNRRIVSGFSFRNLGTVLLLLLALPYLITFLFGNLKEGKAVETIVSDAYGSAANREGIIVVNETALGQEHIPLEIYVADKLERSIDNEFEPEALKAQAVLIRSNLLAAEKDWRSKKEIHVKDEAYGVSVSNAVVNAAAETAGECLMWEGEAAWGAYFAVSNGATRNGVELQFTEYPYLKSVACSRDFLSADYVSSVCYEAGEFERIWKQLQPAVLTEKEKEQMETLSPVPEAEEFELYRDGSGYVLFVTCNGKCVRGEYFREAFLLASASFHIENKADQIVLQVKGVGHGLGMSQFAANELAKEEKDHVAILNYFFQDATITKIE